MSRGERVPASDRQLLARVRACSLCEPELPLGARPILQIHPDARVLIVGQAPGRRAHESGVPFSDPSGDRLRAWMQIDRATFYDATKLALLPMGFCYPGTGPSGDLPPRPECAPTWHAPLRAVLRRVELTIVVGRYALGSRVAGADPGRAGSVTEAVRAWRDEWPEVLPLPHPSPRNNRWLREHPWFEREVVPALRERLRALGLSTME